MLLETHHGWGWNVTKMFDGSKSLTKNSRAVIGIRRVDKIGAIIIFGADT